jgi:hypothetical protein
LKPCDDVPGINLIQIKESQTTFCCLLRNTPRKRGWSWGNPRKEFPMQYRTIFIIAAATILGMACVTSDALARGGRAGGFHAGGFHGAGGFRAAGVRGGRVAGAYRGGAYRGGVYRGGVYGGWRPGVAAGVGAAAVGAAAIGAAATGPYYNYAACGYARYPPCR